MLAFKSDHFLFYFLLFKCLGDFEVKYESTRIFAIFYIYLCVLTFAVAINNVLDELDDMDSMVAVDRADKLEQQFFHDEEYMLSWMRATTCTISPYVQSGNACTREHFLIAVLVALELQCTEDMVKMLSDVSGD